MRWRRLFIRTCLVCSMLVLAACQAVETVILQTATETPAGVATNLPARSMPSEAEWQGIGEGLDWRLVIPDDNPLAQMVAVRVDPAYTRFRVHYEPGEPRTLRAWRDALPEAQVIINANFFSPEFTVLGLLVSDTVVYGQSYTDRGGTFAVENGEVVMWSNLQRLYAGEALEQAIQGFPMLVLEGSAAYTDQRFTQRSRRTVIAEDAAGQIVILATPALGLSLPDLSAFLAQSGLNLLTAINLDGGGSTMLYLAPTGYFLPSLDAVPSVLAVYPR